MLGPSPVCNDVCLSYHSRDAELMLIHRQNSFHRLVSISSPQLSPPLSTTASPSIRPAARRTEPGVSSLDQVPSFPEIEVGRIDDRVSTGETGDELEIFWSAVRRRRGCIELD